MRRLLTAVTIGIFLAAGVVSGIFLAEFTQTGIEIKPGTGKVSVFRPEVIGFMPYWLLDQAHGSYESSVTTLTYFGLTLLPDGHIQMLVNPQEEEPGYTTLRLPKLTDRLQESRQKGQTLSLLVHTANDDTIGGILSDPVTHARNLLEDIIPIMKEKGYTDLNLDIESFTEASESSRRNFTTFVAEVSRGIRGDKIGTLTIEIAPRALIRPFITDAATLAPYADSIVLMTYDYHYAGSFLAGPVAPLGGAGEVSEFDVPTALSRALQVIPRQQLVLGIPFYGYEWDTVSNRPGSPVVPGTGKTASNRRVVELLTDCPDCRSGFDEVTASPYVVIPGDNGEYFRQIFYENRESLTRKLDLARQLELKGVAVWALGYESGELLGPLTEYKNHRLITFF